MRSIYSILKLVFQNIICCSDTQCAHTYVYVYNVSIITIWINR